MSRRSRRPARRFWRARIVTTALATAALLTGVFAAVAITQAAVTLPALAGHWAMNQGSGMSTTDSSGNGNTGALGSGASWTTGPGGAPAVALNGTSTANVTVPKAVVNTSQSFTVSVWVKFNTQAGYQTVVGTDGNSLSSFFLQENAGSGTMVVIRYGSDNSSGTPVTANSGIKPVVGTWYHLVAVDDVSAGRLEIYVNGTEDGPAAAPSSSE